MQQLAVPGSSSVVQLPRIAVWLRVANRSRVVLSRSPLNPWSSSLPLDCPKEQPS